MAAVTRQPFAPLDGARLQNLTSLKNRQNASPLGSGGKRKAELFEADDAENVDPSLSAKRSKADGHSLKKPAYVLTRASNVSTPRHHVRSVLDQPASAPRRLARPAKTPVSRTDGAAIVKPAPLSAPAGRSPTRGKRSGILSSSRRRGVSGSSRPEVPSFNLPGTAGAPFSLDAALRGTIAGYGSRSKPAAAALPSLGEPDMKASWFFDIHEDTPEQEMTNMLQHGTCVLDISSDEESEQKARRDRDEGRDKENVPPADDVSQTSTRPGAASRSVSRPASEDDMLVDGRRVALGEMTTADFFPDGCDETSVVIVPGDDEQEPDAAAARPSSPVLAAAAAVDDVALLMAAPAAGSSKAAVLQPIEGTGETFDLWESGSAKDDTEDAGAAAPQS